MRRRRPPARRSGRQASHVSSNSPSFDPAPPHSTRRRRVSWAHVDAAQPRGEHSPWERNKHARLLFSFPAASLGCVLRIGNCSGFYGDRLSAMREMLEGGSLDVLTGDYLAELTMLILARDRARDADLGYAKAFLVQLEDCLGLALERGVKI